MDLPKDFGIWMINVLNRLIQWYMCERCESLLWLLNKKYLKIISVITELENMWEANIKYYFTFMFVDLIYKYTNDNDRSKV